VAGVQGPNGSRVAAAALKDRDAVVRRRAAEALVRMGQSPDKPSLAPVGEVYGLLNDEDRFVRWAGRIAIEHTPRADWKDRVLKETNPLGGLEGSLAWVRTANGENLQPIVDKLFAMMKQTSLSPENKLRLYRTLMYTTTEIEGGLSAAQREQLYGLVATQFPATDARLNKELALMIGYSGQAPGIAELLSAMPAGNDNQQLQLHYLYALRMVKQGWTTEQKAQLAEIFGRAAKWRGGAQFINFVGQFYDAFADLYATDEEKQILFEKAPEFSPLTPQELEAIQARQAAAGRGGQGRGGRGGPTTPLAARTQGRVVSRQEMMEEAVYQPQQNLSTDEGRSVFEGNCASCHRFGNLGNDHGVTSLNLSSSPLRSAKYSLLEAVMFPNRKLAPEHETTVITTTEGKTIPGLVLRESAQSVSLLTREGTETDVPKTQIKSRQKEKTSLMTEAMADAMNQAQWRNLLAFLTAPPPGT
jgi:putative heme-binding domain-containing protein